MEKFSKWLVKHHRLILIVSILLLIPSYIGVKNTKINYDILDYLPKDLDSTKGQIVLDEEFNNASTGFFMIEKDDVAEVLRVKDEIGKIEGVNKVVWRDDLVDVVVPEEILPDEISDVFYSEDTTLLLVKFDEGSSSELTQDAIDKIRNLESSSQYWLSGMSAIGKDTKELADKETPIYIAIAVALSFIVLSLTTESVIIPVLFLLNIGFAVAYNMGTNVFLGQISYLTKSIAAVLQLAVTMDYSIFLYHRYEDERKIKDTKEEAMEVAVSQTITAITGSSLTTIAGFLALLAMNLGLGKDIGIVMAKGVVFGLLTAVTTLPSLMLVFDKLVHKYQHRIFLPKFDKSSNFIMKNYRWLLIVFVVLFIPSIYGSRRTEEYYDLDRSLPDDMPAIEATRKLKDDYDMSSTHFMIIDANMNNSDKHDLVKELEGIEGITKVVNGSNFIGLRIPKEFIPEDLMENFEKNELESITIQSAYKTASNEVNDQIEKVREIGKRYDEDSLLTGEAVLTRDLTIIADEDFKRVNTFSIISVFVIIALVFRSISVPVLLIMAIQLAIFINMSVPYYINQTIPFVAGIIIGTIQLGSTIDYSILMTTRYIEELQGGIEKHLAMEHTIKATSRSIVSSALAFIAATLGVGIYSNMEIVGVMSRMMARGSFVSMLVIIYLLPSILLVSDKLILKTTKNNK